MRKNARKLTHEQKIQVVRRLASFDSPTAIIKALQAEYGVTITRSSITYYNPATDHGRLCAQQWKTLFFATRKAVTEGTAEIGRASCRERVFRVV